MVDQIADPSAIDPPGVWQCKPRMIAHTRRKWESIQLNELPEGGRLLELVDGGGALFRARLNSEACTHLAKLLTEPLPPPEPPPTGSSS